MNMSAPPETTIRYSGIVNLVREKDLFDDSNTKTKRKHNCIVPCRPVLFRLPRAVRTCNPKKLLATIAPHTVTKNPEQEILRLIDERANQLPLPDGVAVVSAAPDHEPIWDDALAALTVLTKSSGAVWLRSKAPRLSVLSGRFQVSLLVSPTLSTDSKKIPT